MLYTRKGDDGTTKTFGAKERMSKGSDLADALGSLDEINSFLGLAKVKSEEAGFELVGKSFAEIVHDVQQKLFIAQAELAGAPKSIEEAHVKNLELLIDTAEKELPPIKTFFISGGTELAATFDVARTIARRAERRVVASGANLSPFTLAYLNRLSSLLYALARLSNHKAGIVESSPSYS